MSYQVLALKYRPEIFDKVIGQNHVTRTLANSVSSDRVAHAILLTGPRGTGKTTIARIMARAMNCKRGPSSTPCNSCKICKDILRGHCTDVFEIDGASNNSVDQIRDLRENIIYMPSSARYKIYIIDEIHMLSTAAFNALLKTLEEPPVHVLFIFATTEVHKIPPTILSRCQRHDLGRIPPEMISDHMKNICEKENFTIEKQSLDLIALESDGSVRDSLSLLDRVLSSVGEKKIDHENVLDCLGIIDRRLMFDISSAIFRRKGARLIEIIEKINDSGIDLKKLYSDIILHFRNLNVVKICGRDNLPPDITNFEKDEIYQQIEGLSGSYLGMLLQILLKEESMVRFSSNTRISVEAVLLRLLEINSGAQIDRIIKKLDLLAKKIKEISTSEHICKSPERPLPPEEPHVPENTSRAEEPHVPENTGRETGLKQEKKTDTWQDFLEQFKGTAVFNIISKGLIKEKGDRETVLEIDRCSSFEKSRLDKKEKELKNKYKNLSGKNLLIEIRSEKNGGNDSGVPETSFDHPLVVKAVELFKGEIIKKN